MSMCSSEDAKQQCVFTWKIKNFSMCSENKGECLISSIFKAAYLDGTDWCLKLYPRGWKCSGFISCVLHSIQDIPIQIECKCLMEIMDENRRTLVSKNVKIIYEKGFEKLIVCIAREGVSSLREVTLIIQCQLSSVALGKAVSSQNSCTTTIKTKSYSIQCDVKNLNSFPRQEIIKFLYSESSLIDMTIKIPEDDIKIYIRLKTHLSSNFLACNFALLDKEGNECISSRATHLFTSAEIWEFPPFIKRSQLNAESYKYLKDDCFAMKCDFMVSDGYTSTLVEEVEDHSSGEVTAVGNDCFSILKEDIRRLHKDKILTDVKLKVGEQIFFSHKCILSTRSPVFFAMFSQDMVESQTGEVDIQDVDAETVGLFLEYIYSGSVDGLDCEKALKLILAAEKYQVFSLKNKCADLLVSTLSDANVCKILVTADFVQHASLKDSAFNYIKKKPERIFSSKDWENCVKDNLLLATETVCKVSKLWGEQMKKTSC